MIPTNFIDGKYGRGSRLKCIIFMCLVVFLFVMIKIGCISNRKDIIPFVFYRVLR